MLDYSDGPFLKALFHELNRSGIEYAVLRNYDDLPYTASGTDIDIYVNPNGRDKAIQALEKAMRIVKSDNLGLVCTATFYETYIIGFNQLGVWGVCVEFYFGILYKGSLPLVNTQSINRAIISHNGINVVERNIGNALGYIKEILVHDSFRKDKPQYEQSVKVLLENSDDVFQECFSSLGSDAGNLLRRIVESEDDYSRTINIKKFRRHVFSQAFRASPLFCSFSRLRHEFQRLRRYFYPPGTVLAVLGVDGSGKSTLIDAIKPALIDATHNAVFYEHLRPNLLPPLSRLKGRQSKQVGPVTNPHGSSTSSLPGSLFRISYLITDYILGYWLKTRLLIAKRPAIAIFDRYAYDILIDQRRFRIALPASLVRFFVRLAPKPDLVFCLVGSPEVLAARKKELPLDEVTRQVKALQAFAAKEPRAVLINTEQSVDVCRDQILQAIIDHCNALVTR